MNAEFSENLSGNRLADLEMGAARIGTHTALIAMGVVASSDYMVSRFQGQVLTRNGIIQQDGVAIGIALNRLAPEVRVKVEELIALLKVAGDQYFEPVE